MAFPFSILNIAYLAAERKQVIRYGKIVLRLYVYCNGISFKSVTFHSFINRTNNKGVHAFTHCGGVFLYF